MMSVRKICLIALVVLVGWLVLWNFVLQNHAWRQKLTVVVATPSDDVTSSSVVGIVWKKNEFSGGWGGAPFHLTLHGEATAVPLGNGQYLFATLGYHGDEQCTGEMALKIFGPIKPYSFEPASWRAVQAARGQGPATVPPNVYPLLLRFRDIKDPTTAERVEPENLASIFGAGFSIKRMTLKITDEAPTKGVRKILPWLSPSVPWFPITLKTDTSVGPSNLVDWNELQSWN